MSKIEWLHYPGRTPKTWNFIAGCTKVSAECDNCYAIPASHRLAGNPRAPKRYQGVTRLDRLAQPEWSGVINVDESAIAAPGRWKAPALVFVCSMSDLFHPQIRESVQARAFYVMQNSPQHRFLVLTKRPERMKAFIGDLYLRFDMGGPPDNVGLGITPQLQNPGPGIETLLTTTAAFRFLSLEPYWRPIGHPSHWLDWLDWVIVGAETGGYARPTYSRWIYNLIQDCQAANVPVFVKAAGPDHCAPSKDPADWPEQIRVREWPDQWLEVK